MSATVKRPAHRPSRRGVIVETAFELFSSRPVDSVTVADIAHAAGMTSAAIYYHYPSREEILLEGLREFSLTYVAEVERLAAEVIVPARRMGSLFEPFLAWLEDNRTRASVYFVQSRGASQQVEAIRRANTLMLIPMLSSAAKKARGRMPAAEAGVIAVAIIGEIEIFASAFLSEDASFSSLGRQRFTESGSRLADRIAGTTAA
ncbi:helix-turn-helix domain-containing protein [Rhodococcus sp. G-MC3]|uniref:TetR/AcrR family transcriptional regulator n=1 Tax=Rhodococcus sp. G-MC3 TaxID=3046209 RepID=UPI0024B95654|nr:TetR/AcrR family transcriptional regulator [Rhodococcus sp. G-MC3]MDJ0392980.1 helix-turn-helix domain-containing protein [Rhodococcus sp. G-MC3]